MKRVSGSGWRWAMYDWANSVFATTVLAAFFPIFFADFWGAELGSVDALFWLGLGTSAAGVLAAVSAPMVGALADRSRNKARFLGWFALGGAGLTMGLGAIGMGYWGTALTVFVLAQVGFLLSIVVSDSMLAEVSTPENVDFVSGLGFSLGYLGGGLLFLLNVAMVLQPGWFGLPDAAAATRWAFVLVGGWWAVFSLPAITLNLRGPENPPGARRAVAEGWAELKAVAWEIFRDRNALLFLGAYWFYIDGVDTLIAMAVSYGKSLGVSSEELIGTIVIIQFVAFPAALATGWLGQRLGPKPVLLAGLMIYLGITFYASRLTLEPWVVGGVAISKVYGLGVLIALVQGGVQALSRSLFTRLIPPGRAGGWFGFYNLLGRFAAILGPLLMALVSRASGEPRLGILAVSVLFLIGGGLLVAVQVPAGRVADGGERRG